MNDERRFQNWLTDNTTEAFRSDDNQVFGDGQKTIDKLRQLYNYGESVAYERLELEKERVRFFAELAGRPIEVRVEVVQPKHRGFFTWLKELFV